MGCRNGERRAVTNLYLLTTRFQQFPTAWIQQVGGALDRRLFDQQQNLTGSVGEYKSACPVSDCPTGVREVEPVHVPFTRPVIKVR
jgi:hypothetical protein